MQWLSMAQSLAMQWPCIRQRLACSWMVTARATVQACFRHTQAMSIGQQRYTRHCCIFAAGSGRTDFLLGPASSTCPVLLAWQTCWSALCARNIWTEIRQRGLQINQSSADNGFLGSVLQLSSRRIWQYQMPGCEHTGALFVGHAWIKCSVLCGEILKSAASANVSLLAVA